VFCKITRVSELNAVNKEEGVGWSNLGIGLDLKPATAKMALAPERKYGRGVIHANLLLLCIITNTHADMSLACSAAHNK
jgi:hypothetical protein